jgi:preprotein translocase subunit SecA
MTGARARKFSVAVNDPRLKRFQARVDAIDALGQETAAFSDGALKARAAGFKRRLAEDTMNELTGRPVDHVMAITPTRKDRNFA